MRYFTLPLLDTPHLRYCIMDEHDVVVAIDISRPEGTEVEMPNDTVFKVKEVQYDRVNRWKREPKKDNL